MFLVEHLLEAPRDKETLLKSQELRELRKFFQNNKDRFGKAGFFVTAPDFINIASMRDNNISAKNLIANQALDLLNRAFRGEAVMILPIWSDVVLNESSGLTAGVPPTMFFAAPIKNDRGKIIAVVSQRIDPSQDFTRLIQLGRIGKSGETYAFGKYGKLLSESRFDKDLRKIGLIKAGQKAILNISIRNPGGNLLKGFTPTVPRYQQPLTRMADQATKGNCGANVAGYRDYRSVPVYGAWLWDRNLGIGLATEIDAADALSPYRTARNAIVIVLGITVLIALGSLRVAVLIDERANRALQKWIRPREKRSADRRQGVTTEPSAPAPPKLSEDDLPESFAGFDLEVGLRRLMGNKRLYRKLLFDFGSKYTGIAEEIRHALDTGDFEKTHSLVHNLKGLAGNLVATELQAATVEMEKLIKGGQQKISTPEQLDQKFVELEKAILSALQAVQILGSPVQEKPAAPSSVKLSAVPAVSRKLSRWGISSKSVRLPGS